MMCPKCGEEIVHGNHPRLGQSDHAGLYFREYGRFCPKTGKTITVTMRIEDRTWYKRKPRKPDTTIDMFEEPDAIN
jgi:hypothetical protein